MKIVDLKVGMLLDSNYSEYGYYYDGMRVEVAAYDYAVCRLNDNHNPILITDDDNIHLWVDDEEEI